MSFGYGISDATSLVQLAWNTVEGAGKACGEHDKLTREVSRLHKVLLHLRNEISKPDSLLNLANDERREELEAYCAGCERILKVMDVVLKKYNALEDNKRSGKRLWQKIRFGNGEISDLSEIRLKIATHSAAIMMSLNLLSSGSLGRVEKQLINREGDMEGIRETLNWTAAAMMAKSGEGSVLTSFTNNEKNLWRELRRELIREGYTSALLHKHKRLIKAYVAELGDRGVFNKNEDPGIFFDGFDEVVTTDRGESGKRGGGIRKEGIRTKRDSESDKSQGHPKKQKEYVRIGASKRKTPKARVRFEDLSSFGDLEEPSAHSNKPPAPVEQEMAEPHLSPDATPLIKCEDQNGNLASILSTAEIHVVESEPDPNLTSTIGASTDASSTQEPNKDVHPPTESEKHVSTNLLQSDGDNQFEGTRLSIPPLQPKYFLKARENNSFGPNDPFPNTILNQGAPPASNTHFSNYFKHSGKGSYCYDSWDPREYPFILYGNVFDTYSLSRWICRWISFKYGVSSKETELAQAFGMVLIRAVELQKELSLLRGVDGARPSTASMSQALRDETETSRLLQQGLSTLLGWAHQPSFLRLSTNPNMRSILLILDLVPRSRHRPRLPTIFPPHSVFPSTYMDILEIFVSSTVPRAARNIGEPNRGSYWCENPNSTVQFLVEANRRNKRMRNAVELCKLNISRKS